MEKYHAVETLKPLLLLNSLFPRSARASEALPSRTRSRLLTCVRTFALLAALAPCVPPAIAAEPAAPQEPAAASQPAASVDAQSGASPAYTGTEADRPLVALVLAGGSAYGLAHIGAIRVIEELGIPVDLVVGTSMGAVIGGFYALGHDADSLEAIAKTTDWNSLLSDTGPKDPANWSEMQDRGRYIASVNFDNKGFWAQGGVITGNRIVRYLDSTMLDAGKTADFDHLPRRFRAIATNAGTGDRKAFDSGSLPDAIRSSLSIPGVFSPWEVDGQWYVDGGTVDNLPIDVARELGARYIIAIDLVDRSPFDPEAIERTPLPALTRSFDYLLSATSRWQYRNADTVIAVDLAGLSRADFNRTDDFIAKGEAAARESEAELVLLRDAILAGQDTGKPVKIMPMTEQPVTGVLAEGASGADTDFIENTAGKLARKLAGVTAKEPFPTLAGPRKTDFLQSLSASLDRSGRFARIRYSMKTGPKGALLVVTATPQPRDENLQRLSFLYEATLSSSITGNLDLIPGIRYANLTGPGSRLEADAELVDAPGVDIRYVQPVGASFSLIPSYQYRHDFETRLAGSSIGYQYQTTISRLAFAVSFEGLAGAAITAGISSDWLSGVDLPGVETVQNPEHSLIASAGIHVNTLDFPVFPMNGLLTNMEYRSSLPTDSSVTRFETLSFDGRAFLSLGTPFAVALLWRGGTDFSSIADSHPAAPTYYQPDLADRQLFPGPLRVSERIGSHVLGTGVEIKGNLNWGARGVQVPIFLLLHGAVGAVIADPDNTNWETDVFHWNAAAGIGTRLGDSFGIEIRGGAQRDRDGEYLPFIALDVGSIGQGFRP